MTSEPVKKLRHIDDPKWLSAVRDDLDSQAEAWAKHTPSDNMSKLEVIGEHLNVILIELGHRGLVHECPECGLRHMATQP